MAYAQPRQSVYLSRQRDVDVIRRLQSLQRGRGGCVMIRHRELARRLGMSVSTVRRAIDELVAAGHIIRAHVPRPRGGRLAVYRVRLDVVYRRASLLRLAQCALDAAAEQLRGARNRRRDADRSRVSPRGAEAPPQHNENHNRPGQHPSVDVVDRLGLEVMLDQARMLGVDDTQRGWLRLAAARFGVRRTWEVFLLVARRGRYRPNDLARLTWHILKRQREEVMTAW